MTTPKERRHWSRRPVSVELVAKRQAAEPTPDLEFACRGVDVSEGGMQIVTAMMLAAGQKLELFLRNREGRSMRARAEVRWSRAEGGLCRAGLEFLEREELFVIS